MFKKQPETPKSWISNGLFHLTQTEQSILLDSVGWLNDRLIDAAHRLLRAQFNCAGLQSPLLAQNLQFSVQKGEFIQILHDGFGHWLMVSTKGVSADQIRVYDSLYPSIGSFTKRQIAAILQSSNSEIHVEMMDIHLQSGTFDCGLFAIANATALANGISPGTQLYDQTKMRRHFWNCLKAGKLTPFPVLKTRRCSDRVKSTDTIELSCECRLPNSMNMIECSTCKTWHHIACQEVSDEALEDKNAIWLCKNCSS